MNIYEFADVIGKELIIIRYPNRGNRFSCSFEGAEIFKKGSSKRVRGEGISPTTAICSYVCKIQGKILVFNSSSEEKQEFTVPKDLACIKIEVQK